MKRLLTSLGFLILATGCENISPGLPPSLIPGQEGQVVTANLAGQVSQTTADGVFPVEGALVELLQSTDAAMGSPASARKAARPADLFVVGSTTTDIDGRYSFSGLSLGSYAIHVSKAGFALYDSGVFQVSSDIDVSAELKAEEEGNPSRMRGRRR